MAPETTKTTSAHGETGKNGLIERARNAAGEWHCVPGYGWALRFMPPDANRGGARFEIRRAATEPESEYKQYMYTPDWPDLSVSPGGAVWHGDLSANELPDNAQALADAVARSLRALPPHRGWRRFASAFDRLASDFSSPYPELSSWKRFLYSLAGSATFFIMLTLVIAVKPPQLLDWRWFLNAGPGDASPFAAPGIVLLGCFSLLTWFFAFICSRRGGRHSPVRVYLFAYFLPLVVWISASQIGVSGMFYPRQDYGEAP